MLLLGILVIAALIWLFISQPWRGFAAQSNEPQTQTQQPATELPVPIGQTPSATPDSASTSAATPGASSTPTPTPSSSSEIEPCVARAIKVEALTDKDTYGQGQKPQLSIRLTNTGEVDCTLNVGTTKQAFTITSGSDTWWQSTDCQVEPSDMVVVIAAGSVVTSAAPLTWDRTRSSVDTCTSERPSAPAGGASYRLSVSIGGIRAADTALFLLY